MASRVAVLQELAALEAPLSHSQISQRLEPFGFMDAVSKIVLHAEKVYAKGHTVVGCALLYRNVVIPYAVRLRATETFCAETKKSSYPADPIPFRKLTEVAADTISLVTVPRSHRSCLTPITFVRRSFAFAGTSDIASWGSPIRIATSTPTADCTTSDGCQSAAPTC